LAAVAGLIVAGATPAKALPVLAELTAASTAAQVGLATAFGVVVWGVRALTSGKTIRALTWLAAPLILGVRWFTRALTGGRASSARPLLGLLGLLGRVAVVAGAAVGLVVGPLARVAVAAGSGSVAGFVLVLAVAGVLAVAAAVVVVAQVELVPSARTP
jgi:hypothetical protein